MVVDAKSCELVFFSSKTLLMTSKAVGESSRSISVTLDIKTQIQVQSAH